LGRAHRDERKSARSRSVTTRTSSTLPNPANATRSASEPVLNERSPT
jgi:hypothetical protein